MTSAKDPLVAARALLSPGEALLWADRPHPDVLARARLPQQIRGLLGLAVIAAFLWLSFIPNWPSGFRAVVLTLFLAAAALYSCWLLAAPVVARKAAGRTLYAVTDRRVVIREAWPFAREQSFAPAALDETVVVPSVVPGLGSVVFINHKLPWWRRGAGSGYRLVAFYGIPEAQRVAEHIAALKPGAAERLPEENT